jgi:hypothetical protein
VSAHEKEVLHVRPFHVKDGYKTTEFWIASVVVAVACAIVSLQAHGGGIDRNGMIALASAAITSFGYSRARAAVKSGH